MASSRGLGRGLSHGIRRGISHGGPAYQTAVSMLIALGLCMHLMLLGI